MNKHIFRAASSYTLRESGIDNNRWGWFEDSSNRWIIQPVLTYNEALCFDFSHYHRSIERYRKSLIKAMLKDKKFKAMVKQRNNEDIQYLKDFFGVKYLRDCCENFHSEYCNNVMNKTCINCMYRFNSYESFEKGDSNER